jgi:hypothetical protein
MGNPAFEGGDELADAGESSTQGDTTSDTQSEVGESSDDSTAPETTSETTNDTTVGSECDPADAGSCGECMTCTQAGTCMPTPGVACEGESIECSDYAFGLSSGTCYALQAGELSPRCSETGECKQPDASACPELKGDPALECDWRCVDNQSACAPGQYIGQLVVDDMCEVDGATDACQAICSPFDEIVKQSCWDGWCGVDVVEGCMAFACNPLTAECFFGCEDSSQCALDFVCDVEDGMCVPWLP